MVAPRFFCDAMLGGLARWLRAAGYDAAFEYGIDDGVLVRAAAEEQRILLSSDAGVFARNVVRSGAVHALFVPRAMPPESQLAWVVRCLDLGPGEPRCMACGGELLETPKNDVGDRAPPRSFAAFDRFWTCGRCAKLYWRGTHWERIAKALALAFQERIPRARPAAWHGVGRLGPPSDERISREIARTVTGAADALPIGDGLSPRRRPLAR